MPRCVYSLLAPALLAVVLSGPSGRVTAAAPAGVLPRCGTPQPLRQPIPLHDVVAAASRAGLPREALATAGAVAEAESAGDVLAVCVNDDAWHSRDRGLWQINDHYHPEVSDADAFTVAGNAAAMARISSGGMDWRPWHAYTSGAYAHYLAAARAAVATLSVGGGETSDSTAGGTAAWPVTLSLPFDGPVDVSQGYGCTGYVLEPPLGSCAHWHNGIDYGLPAGTPIRAAADGTVVTSGWAEDNGYTGFGNMIVIDHGGGIATLYGHLARLEVRAGQVVHRGEEIGIVGSTGNSKGLHLHFSVFTHGTLADAIDPREALAHGVRGDGSDPPTALGPAQPAPTGGCGGVDVFGHCVDIGGAVGQAIATLVSGLFATINDQLARWLEDLLRPFAVINIWTDTPAILTWANSYVGEGWGYCLMLTDALLVLFILCSGVRRMWDGFAGRRVPPVAAQLGRIILCGAAANISLPLLGALIAASNAIVGLVGVFDNKEILTDIVGLVGLTQLPVLLAGGPLVWIFAVALLVVKIVIFIALFVTMGYRIVVLIFTLVTAPLGLMCCGFPSLERWGRKWNDAFWSALIQQFLQIVMLRVAFGMSTDLADITAAFITEFHTDAGAVNPIDVVAAPLRATTAAIAAAIMLGFISLLLMYFVLKIPRLINLQLAVAAGTAATGAALAAAGWRVGGQAITAAAGAVGGPVAAAGTHMLGTAAFGRPVAFSGDMVGVGVGGTGAAATVAESSGMTTVRDAGAHGQVLRQRAWSEVRTRADGRERVERTTTTTVPAGVSDSGRDERTIEVETREAPHEPRSTQGTPLAWRDIGAAQRAWSAERQARRTRPQSA